MTRECGYSAVMAPTETPLLMTEIASGPVPVVRVRGDLDLATAPQLTDAIHEAAPPAAPAPARVVLDLTALKFCDSTGLRALVRAVREIEGRGAEAVLHVKADGPLDRLLALLSLQEVVRVDYSTPE